VQECRDRSCTAFLTCLRLSGRAVYLRGVIPPQNRTTHQARTVAALQDIKTNVPRFDPTAWEAAIAESPHEERPLIQQQARLSRVLSRFERAEPSPEVLAWLSLWSRCFGLCDAARGAWARQTLLGLGFLERPAFELALHTQVVFEADTNQRLRAYVAWCLDADRRYWSALSQPDHLQRVYDPQPARDHARALISLHPEVSELFGDVEVLSDQEAEIDLATTRRRAEDEVARIDRWLRDDRIAPWVERIAALQLRNKRKFGVQFYALFNESESTVFQRLCQTDSKHAYLSFSRGSSLLHGSTLDGSLRIASAGVAPLVGGSELELAAGVSRVLNWLEWVTLALWLKAEPPLP
jgi:hypothetical protein